MTIGFERLCRLKATSIKAQGPNARRHNDRTVFQGPIGPRLDRALSSGWANQCRAILSWILNPGTSSNQGEVLETRCPLVVLVARDNGPFQSILPSEGATPSSSFYFFIVNCVSILEIIFIVTFTTNTLYFRGHLVCTY